MKVKTNKLKNISEIEECPYCGHDEWFRKQKIYGPVYYKARFDGVEADNGEMYDSTIISDTSKFAFCSNCEKKIGLIED